MLKVELRMDNLTWIELMYPTEFELYKITKEDYIEITNVEEI